MSAVTDPAPLPGAYPTNAQFLAQLTAWKFRTGKTAGVHLVMRAPHGGTLRVVRSQLGRVDPVQVDKAARYLQITPEQFWAGPPARQAPGDDAHPARREPVPDRAQVTTSLEPRPPQPARPPRSHPEGDAPARGALVGGAPAGGGPARDDPADGGSAGAGPAGSVGRGRAGGGSGAACPPMAELFDQLFPRGVQMTSELLIDLERWTELTRKLISYAEAS
jgi:hypothetical protein